MQILAYSLFSIENQGKNLQNFEEKLQVIKEKLQVSLLSFWESMSVEVWPARDHFVLLTMGSIKS